MNAVPFFLPALKGAVIMEENLTPFAFDEYDSKIEKTIPCYREICTQTIDVVKALFPNDIEWLDTGCGTGTLAFMADRACNIKRFALCDPSDRMLYAAKEKLQGAKAKTEFYLTPSQALTFCGEFDAVTAIQAHHYLDKDTRMNATKRCYNALKDGGVYVTFENTAPQTEAGKELVLKRWEQFQVNSGKTRQDAQGHLARYGTEYFPITIQEHLELLEKCGFRVAELFWFSYIQAGFYAVK